MDLNEKLFNAAVDGDADRVHFLLSRGANIQAKDQQNCIPCERSAKAGQIETTNILIDFSGNARAYFGTRSLLAAAKYGQIPLAVNLLVGGIEVNSTDDKGHSALHYAAEHGQPEMIRALRDNGANINAVAIKFRREMPLHMASYKGHTETVEVLCSLGAAVDGKDGQGAAPLHYAAQTGQISVIEALSRLGATLDARDNNGWTPLHFSAREGNTRATEVLIELGADPAPKEYVFKHTPLHLASQQGHADVMLSLMRGGANTTKIVEENKRKSRFSDNRSPLSRSLG